MKLRSEVIALRSFVQVGVPGEGSGTKTGAPRVPYPDLEGLDASLGDLSTMLRVLIVGMREL